MTTAMAARADPRTVRSIEDFLQQNGTTPAAAELSLGTPLYRNASRGAEHGENLYFKVVPDAALDTYFASGEFGNAYSGGNPFRLTKDFSLEMLSMESGASTLLVIPDSPRLSEYVTRKEGSSVLIPSDEPYVPFDGTIVSHIFIFDPSKGSAALAAYADGALRHPDRLPMRTITPSLAEYPSLMGFDASYLESIRREGGSVAKAHYGAVQQAIRIVSHELNLQH